jgi:hypothetical protein
VLTVLQNALSINFFSFCRIIIYAEYFIQQSTTRQKNRASFEARFYLSPYHRPGRSARGRTMRTIWRAPPPLPCPARSAENAVFPVYHRRRFTGGNAASRTSQTPGRHRNRGSELG